MLSCKEIAMTENIIQPFFSVVTEVYNRELTIERTIKSVISQDFFDYEYIIIDFDSTDKSSEKISNFINCSAKKNIKFYKQKHNKNEIERWNKPLMYASGKYIVVLEGDDWFEENYLKMAYSILSSIPNLGIYVGMKENSYRGKKGLIPNRQALSDFLRLSFVPPPSESIFIRTNSVGQPFLYDSKNYIWAAEYSLYRDILFSNYDIYFEFEGYKNKIHRGTSKRKHSVRHIKDSITISEHNKNYLNSKEIRDLDKKIAGMIGKLFAHQILQLNFESELFILFSTKLRRFPFHVFSAFFRVIKRDLIYKIRTKIINK